jgi:hypothetical protein
MTPLLKAARYNSDPAILEMLLNAGADPDAHDLDESTPLHFAAMRGTVQVAAFLLKLGANPYAMNANGNVPYEEVTRDEVIETFWVCMNCKKSNATLLCDNCSVVRYCSTECRQKDWMKHKKNVCKKFQDRKPRAAI